MSLISISQESAFFSEYKRLRKGAPGLTSAIVKCLSKLAIMDSAKKLGLRKGKTLILENLHEMDVFMDYCIYSYRKGGKNAIQRYIDRCDPAEESDEWILLRAMLHSHYSIFQVRAIERGKGLTLFDLLCGEDILLFDVGLSNTATQGMMFAGRILPLGAYYMTSGAFIPLNRVLVERTVVPSAERLLSKVNRRTESVITPDDEDRFSTEIIRAALRDGMMERIAYTEIAGE